MVFVKLNKHDKYVQTLVSKIKHKYDSLSVNVPIRNSKRLLGEIDVLAFKNNKADIYEVKCSHRIAKAKKQLHKIEKNLDINFGRFYFYCGSSGLLVSV